MDKLPELDVRIVKWGGDSEPVVGSFVRIEGDIAYPSFASDATGGVVSVRPDNNVECFEV